MAVEGAWRGLLGAWLVVTACTEPGGGSPEASTTSAGDPTGGATLAASDGPSTTGAPGSDGSTTAGPGSSTGPVRTTAASESGTSGPVPGDTTGPGPVAPCVADCDVELVCTDAWPSARACVDACEANLAEAARFGRACAAAWEDLHACLGTLSCEELLEWLRPTEFPYPCLSEDEVLAFECAGQ